MAAPSSSVVMRSVKLTGPNSRQGLAGVVVSAGKMMKTVKVRIATQEWNRHIRKHFASSYNILVSDPNSSARTGDIVRLASGFRSSKHVRHVLASIIAPFGPPAAARPPIPSVAELQRAREVARKAKLERKMAAWSQDASADEVVQKVRRKVVAEAERRVAWAVEWCEREGWSAVDGSPAQRAVLAFRESETPQTPAPTDAQGPNEEGAAAKAPAMPAEAARVAKDVLPGGAHALGPIRERAMENKRKAARFEEKKARNEEELARVGTRTEGRKS